MKLNYTLIIVLVAFPCWLFSEAEKPGNSAVEAGLNSKEVLPKLNKLEGNLFYGYEDDGSFVYAMFLKKTAKENEYEVTWTLPYYDQKYRNGEIFILAKNFDGKIQFKRGRPEYHLYNGEVDKNGNILNGSRFVLDKNANDKTVWNLFKVK